MNKTINVDEYIHAFTTEVQELLQLIRNAIREAAPEAKEAISYGILTYKTSESIVHFGGFKHHIGFYPTPSGIKAFEKELSMYESAKGSIKFPFDKPIPLDVIKKITVYRLKQIQEKEKKK